MHRIDGQGAPSHSPRLPVAAFPYRHLPPHAGAIIPSLPGKAGNRYGVRYSQLAMFLIAAQEQRLRTLEDVLGE